MYNTDKHTTIEESKTLIDLGVDPKTASYQYYKSKFSENNNEGTPVWGIWDLMDLLPEQIQYKGKIYTLNCSSTGLYYYCLCGLPDDEPVFYSANVKMNYYDAVVWLKENDIKLRREKIYRNDNKGDFEKLLALLDERK